MESGFHQVVGRAPWGDDNILRAHLQLQGLIGQTLSSSHEGGPDERGPLQGSASLQPQLLSSRVH